MKHRIMPVGFVSAQLQPQLKLPKGHITFLLTDLEGSTELLGRLDDRYASLLADVRRLVRAAVRSAGGHEASARGDDVFAVFEHAPAALEAALAIQRAMHAGTWPDGNEVRLRIGMHRGRPALTDTGYVGISVHAAARICFAAHGRQIVMSSAVRAAVIESLADGVSLRSLGAWRFRGLPEPVSAAGALLRRRRYLAGQHAGRREGRGPAPRGRARTLGRRHARHRLRLQSLAAPSRRRRAVDLHHPARVRSLPNCQLPTANCQLPPKMAGITPQAPAGRRAGLRLVRRRRRRLRGRLRLLRVRAAPGGRRSQPDALGLFPAGARGARRGRQSRYLEYAAQSHDTSPRNPADIRVWFDFALQRRPAALVCGRAPRRFARFLGRRQRGVSAHRRASSCAASTTPERSRATATASVWIACSKRSIGAIPPRPNGCATSS